MLTQILFSILGLFCTYLGYQYAFGRPKGFPPGPPRIPVFGSYLFMMCSNFKYLHKAVHNFSKWYHSDIVGFHVGNFKVIAVHSGEGIRQVLNNQNFDGRPLIYLAQMRDPRLEFSGKQNLKPVFYADNGIFFQENAIWKEQRRFVLRYLRDFGFGRRFQDLELVINEEITDMLDLIRGGPKYEHENELVKQNGYKILLPAFFNPFSVNSLFYIIFNERFHRSEQNDMYQLIKMGMQFQRKSDDYGKLLSIIPWIRHICPNWSCYNKLKESNTFIYKYFSSIIDRYIATYDDNSERNFLDLYIRKMKEEQNQGSTESTFSREQLIMSIIDFSFPAFTAIGVQISLLIQYLLLYPKILKRIQQEIDEIVGSGRLPSLEDRKHMHFTEATIREGLRIETLVPSDVPHKALNDCELLGYKIPKGTIVFPSLYAYHNDKRIWVDPENFRPERFLDDTGKLVLRNDVSLPFGAGKRLCAGETFARNMLFLMITTMCQNFNFVLGPGDKLPDLSTNLSGLIISPKDFWVQLEDRNNKHAKISV